MPTGDGYGDRRARVRINRVDTHVTAQHRRDAEGIDRAHGMDVGTAVDVYAVHGGDTGEGVGGPDGTTPVEGEVIAGRQIGKHLVDVAAISASRVHQLLRSWRSSGGGEGTQD